MRAKKKVTENEPNFFGGKEKTGISFVGVDLFPDECEGGSQSVVAITFSSFHPMLLISEMSCYNFVQHRSFWTKLNEIIIMNFIYNAL